MVKMLNGGKSVWADPDLESGGLRVAEEGGDMYFEPFLVENRAFSQEMRVFWHISC